MSLWDQLGVIAPIWLVGFAAAAVLLMTVAGGYRRGVPSGGSHLPFVALVALAAAAWLLVQHTTPVTLFAGSLRLDGLAVAFGLIAITGATITLLMGEAHLREQEQSRGEFIALVLLATVGMMVVATAADLMTLFIAIEIMSLSAYVLAGYRRSSRHAQEAALKYFIYGAFASAFLLMGIALLYGETGRLTGKPTLAFETLAILFAGDQRLSLLAWVAVAALLGGFAFKVAAVPFHMWAPDVYEGAPTPSAGFLAVGIKTAAFAGLCRFVMVTVARSDALGSETAVQIFEVLAILTMVLGNLVAIRQRRIKRMLAYSSIAHAGYLLVGVAALVAEGHRAPGEPRALAAIALYLLAYTAMTLGAFAVVMAFERRQDRRTEITLERLAGIGHRYPALGLAMAVFMFALTGIPPSLGFLGKLSLFGAALAAGRIAIVVVAVLASAVGAFYYLRVVVVMYMQATDTEERRVESHWLTAALWACVAITLAIGLLPEPTLAFLRAALGG